MRWSDIQFNPTLRTLRQFAALWVIAFAGMALWQWLRHDYRVLAGALATLTLVGVWGCWRPGDLRPIFVGWMVLVFPIGWTVSLLVLATLFFAVFTPIGLFFRLTGRDFLGLRRDPAAASYWEPMKLNTDPKSYLNQF
jgi:hypothetical protein